MELIEELENGTQESHNGAIGNIGRSVDKRNKVL